MKISKVIPMFTGYNHSVLANKEELSYIDGTTSTLLEDLSDPNSKNSFWIQWFILNSIIQLCSYVQPFPDLYLHLWGLYTPPPIPCGMLGICIESMQND